MRISVATPTMTLIGPATINVECGSTFTDPGATGDDAEDGLHGQLHGDGQDGAGDHMSRCQIHELRKLHSGSGHDGQGDRYRRLR